MMSLHEYAKYKSVRAAATCKNQRNKQNYSVKTLDRQTNKQQKSFILTEILHAGNNSCLL